MFVDVIMTIYLRLSAIISVVLPFYATYMILVILCIYYYEP